MTPAAPARDPITARLDAFERLLRLPGPEARSMREEIESHVRERARDLIVLGHSEDESARIAIGEIGDAGELAARLRTAARTPRRRLTMNLAAIGLAGGALLTSLVALSGDTGSYSASVYQPVPLTTPADETLVSTSRGPLSQFFNDIGQSGNLPVFVNWRALEAIGLVPDGGVDFEIANLPLREAVSAANDALPSGGGAIAYRVTGGRVIFATSEYFDRRESQLAAYDLREIIKQQHRDGEDPAEERDRVIREVRELMTSVVEPDLWQDNGGGLASVEQYGTKIFVRAPRRLHAQVEWLLDQVGAVPAGGEVKIGFEKDPSRDGVYVLTPRYEPAR